MPTIHVTPLSRLEETLRESGASHLLTLLSEGAVFTPPPAFAAPRLLHLTMHDIAEAREGLTPPSRAHVEAVLSFARGWDRRAPLVVHCHAGISRSTAAAYAIAAALQPERDEDELARELRRLSPMATPNPLIVAHADALLGRKGRMIAAVRAIGRGAEAFEGVPFALALTPDPASPRSG